MTDVNVLKIYNFVDSDNNQLQLRFGVLVDRDDLPPKDMGWRWSFVGTKIPMPVRCGTWFSGFPADIMLDWLKSQGWTACACVNLITGKVIVYESQVKSKLCDVLSKLKPLDILEERALATALTLLVKNGNVTRACMLYRYIYGGSINDANKAIRTICHDELLDKQ